MDRYTLNTEEIIEIFKTDINLSKAELSALKSLAGKARRLLFNKGDYIFKSGEDSNYFYLVENGKVILSKEAASGRSFTYIVATGGMTLNGITCFKSSPRLFSARVVEDAAIISIPCSEFREWVRDNPDVAIGILGTMGDLLDGAYTRILDLIDESVETRIMNVLHMLSSRIGPALPLTNNDLAEMVGTSRETAARVISRLQSAEIISKSRGNITILDKERLDDISSCPFFII